MNKTVILSTLFLIVFGQSFSAVCTSEQAQPNSNSAPGSSKQSESTAPSAVGIFAKNILGIIQIQIGAGALTAAALSGLHLKELYPSHIVPMIKSLMNQLQHDTPPSDEWSNRYFSTIFAGAFFHATLISGALLGTMFIVKGIKNLYPQKVSDKEAATSEG